MKNKTTQSLLMLLMAMVAPWLASCGDVIYQDEGDCEVTYQLQFVYDMNMKWADAFASEVKSVRVYVFDENDRLVWTTTESGSKLATGDYRLTLPLNPGNYHVLAWCGADNNPGNEHFTIAPSLANVSHYSDATCRLERQYADGKAWSIKELHSLFHGDIQLQLPDYSDEGETYTYQIPLTKDTNNLQIVLQQLSGKSLDVNDFTFTVTDQNGFMAADNSPLADETINYRPWQTASGMAGIEIKNPESRSETITQVNAAKAEFTLARLMANHHDQMMLSVVRNEDGKEIIRIPVIDYCLLVKGFEHAKLQDQEYLDRQDSYSMVFFLDENYEYVATTIIINSWRIVFQEQELNSGN